MPDPSPIWTRYDPESVVDELGWLWSSEAEEWRLCVTREHEGPDGPLTLHFPGVDGMLSAEADPEDWRGVSYLPVLRPTVVPGDIDALEVVVRFDGGASATHAFGNAATANNVSAAIFAALQLGRRSSDDG